MIQSYCLTIPKEKCAQQVLSLTKGYWNDEEKNKQAFFEHDGKRFYRTGDVCAIDDEGDIGYYGRKDSQIKIQGFRIELGEIEHVARSFYNEEFAVVALPLYDGDNNCFYSYCDRNRNTQR